jgi:hypothetical protein
VTPKQEPKIIEQDKKEQVKVKEETKLQKIPISQIFGYKVISEK